MLFCIIDLVHYSFRREMLGGLNLTATLQLSPKEFKKLVRNPELNHDSML